jgi:hypothetical protein
MAWGVDITNTADGTCEGLTLMSTRWYILPSAAAIRLYEQVAWCRGCAKFVRAEHLGSLEEIDAQMAKYRQEVADRRRKLDGWLYRLRLKDGGQLSHEISVYQDAVAEYEMRRQWRLDRQSPPRCLECGSTELMLPPDDEEFPHPAGKGRIRVSITSHMELAVCAAEHYTSDGLRLEAGQIPV